MMCHNRSNFLGFPLFALSYLFITARIRNVCKQLFCSSSLRFNPCCRRGFSCFDILTLSHLGFQLCLKKISRTNYSCIYLKKLILFFCLQDPPGPIDNSKITVNKNGHFVLKQGNIIIYFCFDAKYMCPSICLWILKV